MGLDTRFSGEASELVGAVGPGAAAAAAVLAVLRFRGRPVPRGLWVALAAGLAFWFLAAFNANELRPSNSARILLPSGIFILLIAVEALRDLRPSPSALLIVTGVDPARGRSQPDRASGRLRRAREHQRYGPGPARGDRANPGRESGLRAQLLPLDHPAHHRPVP